MAKASKLWWWNRFKALVYHVTHGIKSRGKDDGIEHLSECKYCKKQFEEWCKNGN